MAGPAHATIDVTLQMQLGNPSGASTDTNNHDHYLIQRTVEAIDYSDNLGEPVWASWDLTAGDIGTNSRSTFITDTNLPPNFTRYSTGIYNNAGWDRGHLCPSKDRTDTSTNNDLVFFMSNVLPQNALNNSGVWLQFENYCRDLVQSTNNYELLLICGGSGYGIARLTNGPFIPDFVWKIAVVVPAGTNSAANRITGTNRVIAVKIPNNDTATNTWPAYVTSAAQIQVDTGLTFFTALPADVAATLRSKVDGQTNPPPLIFAFSPTNGAAGTNITITGTNFASASAVAFNGVTAAFTVISTNQITATVPTNGSSGYVSVTTPSGTAISADSFTVLTSGGGTVYSGLLAGWDVSTLTGGLNNYGPSPFAATTNAANLAIGGLTRGSGVKQSGTAGADGWGGTGFTNLTASAATASNQFVTFSITASNGFKVSITSISRFDYYRSPSGATNAVLQFQIGSGVFTDITNLTYPAAGSSATNRPINLSGVAALQNVGANTNVTLRIVNYGGTSSAGTWYIYDTAGSAAPDLAVQGVVTQVLTTNAPAAVPSFTLVTLANNQFSFTLSGTAGTNYIVQATTNLAATNWISLATNAAPFVFVQSNADSFGQRFYRAQIRQ
jgi:DNA/RNA endonuclease G (NUC1)